MRSNPEVTIIGAGLAGLCCALYLQEHDVSCQILEASDGVGGRVRTDVVDGFLLDRGFQVFLTAYPEAQRVLDYESLNLKSFYPSTRVYFNGKFHHLADPLRRPLDGMRSIFSAVGKWGDKMRIGQLNQRLVSDDLDDIFRRPEKTTIKLLQKEKFSDAMIDRFFRPFFGGVFMDRELKASSRMFEFIFRMFAEGKTVLPARGMQAIPKQIADRLEKDTIRTGAWVAAIEDKTVTLTSGERIPTNIIVVATDGSEAARLVNYNFTIPEWRSVTCFYFTADHPPVTEPILYLDGEGKGPVNHLCVPSVVSSAYAPSGSALISATVLGNPTQNDDELKEAVKTQLKKWFGIRTVRRWRHLRTYRVLQAQPMPVIHDLSSPLRDVQIRPGIYICGDHREHVSIEGAMISGRRAAEVILKELKRDVASETKLLEEGP